MATPWDRAAAGYLDELVPRFVPYHLDLIRESALAPGQHALVVSSGPGSEVLAAARAIGAQGYVHATDKSAEMVRLCEASVKEAGFEANVTCAVADASDARNPRDPSHRWDAIVCAFGLWQIEAREAALKAWAHALGPRGKIAIATWGPPDEGDPFERLASCLRELEPDYPLPPGRIVGERNAMVAMFEHAGLVMVRHTVVRHTLSFRSAEAFVRALREACTWRKVWEDIGDLRIERLAARFYEFTGGPDVPLSFEAPATLAVAALPGTEVELEHRPSVRVPANLANPKKGA